MDKAYLCGFWLVSARFNTLQKIYEAMHDKVQCLLSIIVVKKHNILISQQKVGAKPPLAK